MTTIFGILGISDRDTTVDSVGQQAVYDATVEYLNRHNADVDAMRGIFVERTDTVYTERYYLPGGGMMEQSTRLTRPAAAKPYGYFDVSYDLMDFRDQLAWDDIAIAYLTVQKYQLAVQNIQVRHLNTVRFQILKHLLNPTNPTFVDEVRGSLTIRRLANTDSTTYPPVIGSDTGADDNHYLASGYATSSISDTNNPFVTMRDELEEHFGQGDLVTFINNAERAKVEALSDFVSVDDRYTTAGASTPTVSNIPAGIPGQVIGRINNSWVSEWRWMPATYMFMTDMMQAAPLVRRVDVPTNIRGRGVLELVSQQSEFPLTESFWRFREGYGVGNRLNGVAMKLTTGSYDAPTTYQ